MFFIYETWGGTHFSGPKVAPGIVKLPEDYSTTRGELQGHCEETKES